MFIRFDRNFKRTSRRSRGIFAVWGGVAAVFLILVGSSPLSFPDTAPTQAPGSPLVGKTWVRTGGPMGGRGYDIRMRPDNPDILYVTDQFTGIHKSTDGGGTWFPINDGIDARAGSSGDAIPTFCLTIDPNNYDIIWAGTLEFRGVYRSVNGGLTWEKRVNGIPDGGLTFRGFSIEPGNSNVVYAAAEIGFGPGAAFSRSGGIVFKTMDGGLNWQEIWRGDNVARYVLIDPTNVKTLYVSTGIWDREAANSDGAANIPGGVGILKSTDGGETWKTINNGLNNLYIGSLFMHPTDPRILIAGAGAGLTPAFVSGSGAYITTDAGENWSHVLVTGDSTTITAISSVEFSTKDPNIVYAGGIGFWRSSDGGKTWTRYWGQTGFWGPLGVRLGMPIDFQVDPRNVDRIFTNNYNGGNVLSEDGGQTWLESTTGYTGAEVNALTVHALNPAVVYASEKGGPFLSRNGGRIWRGTNTVTNSIPVPGCAKIVIDPINSKHLLMSESSNGRVYESQDAGLTWTMIINYQVELYNKTAGLGCNQSLLAITFAPSQPQKVYGGFGYNVCGPYTAELMKKFPIMSYLTSEDGGHTWSRREGTNLDGWSVYDIAVHPTNADIAWAATGGAGVFHTTDGGTTWEAVSNGLISLYVAKLALNPQNSNQLFAASPENGVFKTDDGGLTWRSASSGMNPNESVSSVAIDPVRPNVVYAGSQASGVFVSEDAGESWRLINNGLRTRAVRSMDISSDGLVLYVGTIGEGVFRLGDLTAPKITGITPQIGSSLGGTVVTIHGSGFVGGDTTVTFGGVAGANVNVISSASLTVMTPAHAAGTVPVAVTTSYGTGTQTAGFTYVIPPTMYVSPSSLNFAGIKTGASGSLTSVTTSQNVTIGFAGGSGTWTAAADQPWVQVTNGSGTGVGQFTVGIINPGNILGASTYVTAHVTVASPSFLPCVVGVTLTLMNTGSIPFGDFATPIDGTTGITGAIPVTGWVLDDIEVTSVKIYRDPVAGEGSGLVFIGDAIFVEGARPDIETGYPGYPMNYKAGWGYMLLTNFLPNQGNGTYKLHAFAMDKEGNQVLLGSKTIVCSNATAVKPFGTIDTPAQGGDASGHLYLNFGWVLTPMPKTVPKNGSTILVYVDGAYVGNLSTAPNVYNQYRADVSEAFPGLNNTGAPGAGGPVGAFFLNTTIYPNGVHTIFWIATDDAGAADGIGSRYFNVVNTGTSANVLSHCEPLGVANTHLDSILNLPLSFDPLTVKRGFNLAAPPETILPDNYGSIHIEMREVERIELDFEMGSGRLERYNPPTPPFRKGGEYVRYSGYQIVGDQLRPLPIGSTLDPFTGTFSWLPGPGFVGKYEMVFLKEDGLGVTKRIPIGVTIKPKF